MKNLIVLLSILTVASSAFAQVNKYDWEEKPFYDIDTAEYTKYSAVVMLDHRIRQYKGSESTPVSIAYAKHLAIKILDEKAIEDYNRVFVPSSKEVIEIKARTIKPDGTIVNVKDENIKEIEDEDYGNFNIFAIEGVEEGDVLEYVYKLKFKTDWCGMEIFQKDIPVKKATFEIYYTSFFNIDTKAYSGFSSMKESSTSYRLQSTTKNIPAFPDEGSSLANNHKMRVGYRVESVNLRGGAYTSNIVKWQNISKNYVNEANLVKNVSGYKTIFKDLGITEGVPKEEVISRLEKYIKENFNYTNRGLDIKSFKKIVKLRKGNEENLTRLMKYLLDKQGINSVWMISSNRNYLQIDPDFPDFTLLSEHILYIPSTGKYLAMGYQLLRYGPPPVSVLNNHGLVVDNVLGQVKEIKYDVSDYSSQVIDAEISFDDDFEKTIIEKQMEFTGYRSVGIRAALSSSDESTRNSIKEDYMTSFMGEATVENTEVENEGFDHAATNKPVKVKATINATELTENADDIVIFSFGKIIGEQNELYEEVDRETPIEIGYPIVYDTKIVVNIPEGYTVSGLEDCSIKNEYTEDGKTLAAFESSAKEKNGKVVITLKEFYKAYTYDVDKYEEYRQVINSAADFNKLVLVFEKEETNDGDDDGDEDE